MSRFRSPLRPSVPESLSVLADLQEFGIPGQELPVPSAAAIASLADAATPSPRASGSRRLSDSSMVLPSLDDETYLDFTPGTTPVTPGELPVASFFPSNLMILKWGSQCAPLLPTSPCQVRPSSTWSCPSPGG